MGENSHTLNAACPVRPVIRPSISALLSRDLSHCGAESVKIKLPVGIAERDGRIINEVWVTPLDGRAEMMIENSGRDAGFIAWVTTLLNHAVRIDGDFPGGAGSERFSVADRDLIVCALRMLTFGPEIWGIVQCPHPECKAWLDIIFDLSTVEMPAGNGWQEHQAAIEHASRTIHFCYREPNGTDQEAAARLLHVDPLKARHELLSRCLMSAEGIPDTSPKSLGELPEELVDKIDKAISEGITTFDWDLKMKCSECNRSFLSTLDIQAYFWEELQIMRDDFWTEVHRLAFYYHWSEKEILSLTRWRRKMYLNQIRRQLENTNYA